MYNEINLFGVIGRTEDGSGITAQQIKTQLAKMDQMQPLLVRIDSEGGSVFDGFSIYEAFASYPGPKKAIVESTAFSIASYIAMAFDEVEISENGYVMIHEPSTDTHGTASELAKNADLLSKLDQSMVAAYAKKTGLSEDDARGLMREETFMNASEALAMGFVNRINPTQVKTRVTPQAKHRNMPQRVYAALFGAGSGGDTREPTKDEPMSNTPTAATLQEIRAAFPKAKAEFVLKCLEAQKPMASVAAAAAEELMAENQELMAKVAAMEEEMAALKAQALEVVVEPSEEEEMPEEEMAKAKAMEDEEMKAKATARVGLKPIAKAKQVVSKSAVAKWNETVNACLTRVGGNKVKAAALANRENPGLREQMLREVN